MRDERFMGMPLDQVALPLGHRVIRLKNVLGAGDKWPDVYTANHNIFRLDREGRIVWQVTRVELPGRPSWPELDRMAKERDPSSEGYFDPFWSIYPRDGRFYLEPTPPYMNEDKEKGIVTREYRPGCLLRASTSWTSYNLDLETGVATCTGEQIR